jgi:hypothetical protein
MKPVDSFCRAAAIGTAPQTQNNSRDSLRPPRGRLLLTEEGLASFDWRRVVALLARPGAGVDPASFQDYKPGGARKGTCRARSFWRLCGMKQIIRELKRQAAGEKLEPEQLKGLIRAGYVYRNGDEHLLTDMGRDALAQPGVYPSNS